VTAALLTTRRLCDTCATFAAHLPAELVRHPCGHCAPFLSFVTVDRPPPRARCDCNDYYPDLPHKVGCASLGPSPWIGQRVAIYARSDWGYVHPVAWERAKANGQKIVTDAIVGSGTLAEAHQIVRFKAKHKYDDPLTTLGLSSCIEVTDDDLLLWTHHDGGFRSIKDQLPLQDWTPGRWALRFTDVARTSERCSPCWVKGNENFHRGVPVVAPVLSGEHPIYKEWTPT
jgi:hypothetical protein